MLTEINILESGGFKMPGLFNKKILQQRLNKYSVPDIERKMEVVNKWQSSLKTIKGLNEQRLQAAFLQGIFQKVLGYDNEIEGREWTMEIECSTEIDARTPDAILGFYRKDGGQLEEDHRVVVELKGPQVSLEKDQNRKGATYKSPVDQAFSYTNSLDRCQWVIVSNFMEIRLYKVGRSKEYYELFHLDDLTELQEFLKFHYLLGRDNLISRTDNSLTLQLSEATRKRNEDISVEFYNLYKEVRVDLFEHLRENNVSLDPEVLVNKAQKIMDRIIFICFCEDKGLLPNDIIHSAISRGKNTFSPIDNYIWNEFRGIFRAIESGSTDHNINAYDGGLFEYDELLDNLVIKDEFFEVIYEISDYDFDSDVDVNILGHIFEQSINDLEKLKSDVKNNNYDINESRRKKEGIYYTPRFITRYIVENTVGGYLEDIKEELGYYELPDLEEVGNDSRLSGDIDDYLDFYDQYEKKVKSIKILDPACGSGAFLNQAFDYLLKEHNWLNSQRDLLENIKNNNVNEEKSNEYQISIFTREPLHKNILKSNLFGVDLNSESVEITKLSLWLKTANRHQSLTNLDQNIICGNSLVEDDEIAGEKAVKWEQEFPEIMNKGGFDVIIGNPPYVKEYNNRHAFDGLRDSPYYQGKMDIWTFFGCIGLDLLKTGGYFSFIAPNNWITNMGASIFRNKVLKESVFKKYLDFGNYKVFADAEIQTMIFVLKKKLNPGKYKVDYRKIQDKKIDEDQLANLLQSDFEVNSDISCKSFRAGIDPEKTRDKPINFSGTAVNSVLNKIKKKSNYNLKDEAIRTGIDVHQDFVKERHLNELDDSGIKKGDGIFVISDQEKEKMNLSETELEYIKPYYTTEQLHRYYGDSQNNYWIIYTTSGIEEYIDDLPRIKAHFDQFADIITSDHAPYGLHRAREEKFFRGEKIISLRKTAKPHFTYTNFDCYVSQTYYVIKSEVINLKFLTGLLNSKVIYFWLKNRGKIQGDNLQVDKAPLLKLPLLKPEKDEQNVLAEKVEEIIEKKAAYHDTEEIDFAEMKNKYLSDNGPKLEEIIDDKEFKNKIYSGRARKVRKLTVSINTNIITIYSKKAGSGRYELLKFQEDNRYKRQLLKYYLENLTAKKLEEINSNYSGNVLNRVLQLEIPDYQKEEVIRKVVNEWESFQEEMEGLKKEMADLRAQIDREVYALYNLNQEDVEIIEENL